MSNVDASITMDVTTNDAPDRFPSLASLRAAHGELVRRRRESGDTPEFMDEVASFIRRGRATGVLLDANEDRRASQSLLDYWANALYRTSREPPDATLADFDPALAPELPDALCPYLGLDAFREDDEDRFFGRQRLMEKLVDRLGKNRLLAVVGPSGSGKSSLVLAGLLPALRAGAVPGSQDWHYYPPMVPGSNPLANLARLLRPDGASATGWERRQIVWFQKEPSHLSQLMSELQVATLLIIDQFEELFTLCRDDDVRQAFIDNLLDLIQAPDATHTVILTIRIDFEPRVARLPRFYPLFEEAQVRVTPLSAGELREAIEGPAELVGLKFEEGVVDALLQDILGEPAALPLLQFTLLKLWEDRERNRVTWEAYRRLGGGRQALAHSADEFYEGLIPEERVTARRIILRMVRPGEGLEVTSNRIRRATIYRAGEARDRIDRVLDKLAQARLVRLTQGDTLADAQVEVAHEALVRNWPRLVNWLEREREEMRRRLRLTAAAEQWVALGRDPEVLLRGVLLDEALRYEDLNELEAGFVRASQAAVEEARRKEEEARQKELEQARALAEEQRRRAEGEARSAGHLRLLLAALAAVFILALWVAAFAIIQLHHVEQYNRFLDASRLAAQAQGVLEEHPLRSLLLAVEALNITLQAGDPPVPDAEGALWQALANLGGRGLGSHDGPISAVAIGPDDRWLVTGSWDNTARLWDLTDPDPAASPIVLRGHQDAVLAVAISTDNHWLVTGSADATARLWDLTNSGPAAAPIILTGHEGAITIVAISPDSHWLVTGSADDTARLWDLTDSDVTSPSEGLATATIVLPGHKDAITAVAISPDNHWLVTGSADATVCLWDLTAKDLVTASIGLPGHEQRITAVAFSPDNHWLVTASADATARLWDLTAPDVTSSSEGPAAAPIILRGRDDPISAVAISPDNHWLVTGSDDAIARLWDLTDPDLAAAAPVVLRGHERGITAVAISPDNHWLVTGSADATARLWDLTDPGLAAAAPIVLRGHEQRITAVAFSSDNRWLVAGGTDATARLWDLTDPGRAAAAPIVLRGHERRITTVAISPDNHWLVTGSADDTARLWDLTNSGPAAAPIILTGHKDPITIVAISPDSHWLVTGSADDTARLWNLTNSDPAAAPIVLRGHVDSISTVAISPDNHWLVTGSVDATAGLWDLTDPDVTSPSEGLATATIVLPGHKDAITAVAFSPDNHWLVTGSADATARLWDLTAPDVTSSSEGPAAASVILRGHVDSISAVAISPDNRWLVTGSADTTASLWDLTDPDVTSPSEGLATVTIVLHGHTDAITAVAISPDNRWLVTGSADATARLWDLTAKDLVTASIGLPGHKKRIAAVAISPDSHWLVTGSDDATACLWDLTAPDPAATPVVLPGHELLITAVAFSPDNRWVITGSFDRTARLWTLRLDELIDLACRTAGRNLTDEEWEQYLPREEYRQTCSN